MKKLILLFAIAISSCSASDSATCKSKCQFTTDYTVGKFFYVNDVDVDCETNKPSTETIKKIQSTQSQTIFFCQCY